MLRRVVAALFLATAATGARAQEAGVPPPATAAAPPATAAASANLDAKKLIAPKATPELLEKGRLAFAVSCVVCHGEKGLGDGPAGQMLNPRPRDFSKDPFKQGGKPAELFITISEGVKDTPMVGWAHLTEEDRWGLAYHVLSLAPAKAAKKAKGAGPSVASPDRAGTGPR